MTPLSGGANRARHAHRAQKLVEVIHARARAFLGVERGEGGIAGVQCACGFHSQPIDALGAHLTLCDAVAQRLEGSKRPTKLLAISD